MKISSKKSIKNFRLSRVSLWLAIGSLIIGLVAWAIYVFAANITANKYSYGENIGWQNWAATDGDGVTIDANGAIGYIWAENVGWIKLDYDGVAGAINTSATNWGVTNDGNGNLAGYAWAENIGWINFNPIHGGVSVDTVGKLSGYAWAENVGWINLSGTAVNETAYYVESSYAPSIIYFISTVSESGEASTKDYTSLASWQAGVQCDLTHSVTGEWDTQVEGDIADQTAVTWDSGTSSGTLIHMTKVAKSGKDAFLLVTTDTLENNDLVSDGLNTFTVNGTPASAIAVAKIDGTGTSAETSALTISGWTSSASNYIKIYTTASARHSGVWSDTKYRIIPTTGIALQINDENVRIDGLQFSSSDDSIVVTSNTGDCDIRLSNNIFKGNATDSKYGLSFGAAGASSSFVAWNNIIYDMSGTSAAGIQWNDADWTGYIYNNTIVDCNYGLLRTLDTAQYCKNNLIKATDAFNGTFTDNDSFNDYNSISEDAISAACGSNGRYNQTFTFNNAASDDYHLALNDAGAKNYGYDLCTNEEVAWQDDIDSERRSIGASWDIGADDADTAVPVISDLVITNTTLNNTYSVKDTDDIQVTATITESTLSDGDVTYITADLSGFGASDEANPDSYTSNLATWTLSSVTCTPADGTITVTVDATDLAGNPAVQASETITSDNTAPIFTTQYYSDTGLTTSLGDNPKLKAGTYYLKITSDGALAAAPTVSSDAEGSNNDVSGGTSVLVSGNVYKYTRTIIADAGAVGAVLENISITATDVRGNESASVNPSDEATKAAYTDTVVPAAFTTGAVVTTGGTVLAGKWNASNTGLTVTVPIDVAASDASLIGGNVQLEFKNASGSYVNLDSASTITSDERTATTKDISVAAATMEALTDAFGEDEVLTFNAKINDSASNQVEGTASTTTISVDQTLPAGLADFSVASVTATTAVLTWTAATDTNFNHYEIWYGTTLADVQARTAGDGAAEWDDSDDGDLATASTATTTITGLSLDSSLYYFKIWAVDDYGNESTLTYTNADAIVSTCTWDNGSADGLWSNPLNWSSNTLPSTGDNVVFDTTSNTDCTADIVADNLGSLTLDTGYTATLTINADAVAGSGALTLTGSGDALKVVAGTILCKGDTTAVNAASGGTAEIPHGTGITFNLSAGNVVVSADGAIHANYQGFPEGAGPGAGEDSASSGGGPAAIGKNIEARAGFEALCKKYFGYNFLDSGYPLIYRGIISMFKFVLIINNQSLFFKKEADDNFHVFARTIKQWGEATATADPRTFAFNGFHLLEKISKYQLHNSIHGLAVFVESSSMYMWTGISFNVSRKMLEYAEQGSAGVHPVSRATYRFTLKMQEFMTGDWKVDEDFQQVYEMGTRVGHFWPLAIYVMYSGMVNIELGKFDALLDTVKKLNEISDTFDNNHAKAQMYRMMLPGYYRFRRLDEAIKLADEGIDYTRKTGHFAMLMVLYCSKSQILTLKGHINEAQIIGNLPNSSMQFRALLFF